MNDDITDQATTDEREADPCSLRTNEGAPMTMSDTSPHMQTDAPAHEDLAAELAALRSELEELRASLAAEVRTRRLVVIDQEGREALYTESYGSAMRLGLRWPYGPGDDDYSEVAMYAGNEDAPVAALALGVGGEILATFDVRSDLDDTKHHAEAGLDVAEQTRDSWSHTFDVRRTLRLRPEAIKMGFGGWAPAAAATFHVIDE